MSDLLNIQTGSDIDSDCNSSEASIQFLDPDSDDALEISDKIELLSTDSDESEKFDTANSDAVNQNSTTNYNVDIVSDSDEFIEINTGDGSDSDEFIELNSDYNESGSKTPMLISSSSDEFKELATDSEDEKEAIKSRRPFSNLFKKREQDSKCKQCKKCNQNKNVEKTKKKTDRCKICI